MTIIKSFEHFINGEYRPSVSGKTMDVLNPSTGKKYATVSAGDEQDVKLAVAAAKAASPAWMLLPLVKKQIILQKIADLITDRLEELAEAESLDTGKPISLARELDIPRAAANFSFFGAAATQWSSESHVMPGQAFNFTLRDALGVVGCISPWNLPLYLFTWKIAPALAAGNTVVGKPSELTPATAAMLGKICNEAGLPLGVLNIIHGTGPEAGEAIVKHEDVKAISFTGSTAVGKKIAMLCAEQLKKVSLELGGKNPIIIFGDCDYQNMLQTTIRSAFSNQGQICLCGSRIFVEASLYDKFLSDFIFRTKRMKIGDPMDPDTDIGSLISETHLNKVLSYIELAKKEGGTIATGGNKVKLKGSLGDGYYVEPTIITGLGQDCRTNREEIFGPVVSIIPFETEEEVLAMANDTNYGLASVIWTNHLSRAHRVSSGLQSGIVWVNCWMLRDLRTPFGGVKQSGLGREGGWEAMRFFTEAKNITVAYPH
ncbi:MAG TPA: aldehyde dehydrogenase [Saprospiraceae bacterium]|nr:aldehyde dehydrogenase [Saprospiraceae bacterium]